MVVAEVLAMLSTLVGFVGVVLKVKEAYNKSKLKKVEATREHPLEMALVSQPATDSLEPVVEERPVDVAPLSVWPTERSQGMVPSVDEQRKHQGGGKGKTTIPIDLDMTL
jgi:hypothetical protein